MTKKVLNKKFGSFFSTKNKGKEVKHQSNKDSLNFYTLLQYSTTLDKICMIIGAICSVLSGLVLPYTMLLFGDVTGAIVSHASKYNDTLSTEEKSSLARELNNDVWTFSVETLGVGFIIIITNYLSTVLFSYSSIRQIFRIRKKFLEKTLSQDIAWFDTNRTGDFATTFTQNISKIEEGIGDRIGTFIFYETSFVSGVVMSLLKGWKLALVCLVSLPLSAVLMAVLSWMSTKFSKREMDAYGAAGAIAEEVFSSIKTVVAFDGQEKEMCRYNKHLLDAKRNNIKKSFFSGLSQGILWFFIYGCYALSFWYGVELILAERHLPHEEQIYTPSNMIGIFCCILIATMNFGMAAPFLETFGSAKGAAQKIFNVLDSESKIKRHINTGRVLDKLSFNVTFDNIYFNYPSRPDVKVLRGFSLKIKIGETVALVGSSGCGKSTTIQLLQRFYDPTEGRIQIDDVDIRDLNQQWLMEKIAVVSQEPALFGVTIAENIRLGKLNATQDEIEEAAKKANAHKFILTLPRGYETVLGEKGAQLSGGQKQRIAIARALVKNPEMLLLDEATSALDTTSEAEVQAALDSISGSCTTIIIAHRLSTIRNATRIIVIDEGAVLEEGTHSQLMDQKGAYYNLVLSQGFTDSAEEQALNERQPITELHASICMAILFGVIKRLVVTIYLMVFIVVGQKRRFSSFSGEENKLTYEGNDDALKEDIVVDEPKPKGVLWKIMKMTSSDWCYIVLGTISAIITGALLPVYGILYGCIIGVFVYENDDLVRTESNKFCLCFLVLGIIAGSTTFMNIFAFSISGENLTFKIRSKMFECLLGNEIGWYDKKENGVGVICTKLAGDAVSVQGVAGAQIGTTLNFLGTLTLTCAISFYYEWRTTLVLLAVCPIMFFSIYFESTIMRQDGRKNQAMLESSAKLAVEAISNIRTVISLGCEKVFLEQYIKELLPYQSMARKKSHFRGIVFGMGRSFMLFIYIIGIKFGSSLIINGEVDYGAIITVNEVVIVGTMSVGNILSASPNFQKGLAAAARIIGTLERKPCIRNVENPLVSLWDDETVEYSQINFSYPTRPSATILNGLNLTIPKGKTVALVGSSGCGKSTIVQLLERFYDPGYGLLTVNGTDVKQMELRALRSQLGIVSQEPNLFDKTIAENIAYGANYKTVEMDDIIEAAKSANIHNFISNLPLGYETKVGSKGTQLSGGQKQRIAIARALVRNPKILLLDEATSALDNESEKIVQETLDSARQGRTCITIAHRLTTIQDADIICVLDKGVVAEMGTHKQLLDKRGLYYKFYKLQSGHT